MEGNARLIEAALLEDLGEAFVDITTEALVGQEEAKANIVANQSGVAAGMTVAEAVFHRINPSVVWEPIVGDGDYFVGGSVVASVSGGLLGILKAERTALNFLAHLSGVATLTRRFVDEVKGTDAEIFDTRKTLPGLRVLEKEAVTVGGGVNHRFGLYDGILIKDNHLVGRDLMAAVSAARAAHSGKTIEVEVDTVVQLRMALDAEADIILLDNMDITTLASAIALAKGRAVIEVSGGVNLETVGPIARAGAQRISVGALTQAAAPVDFSLTVLGA